jgi:coatomer subunit beta
MAANLYAKSIFGEDVLANLSIEKPVHLPATSPVQGHIRIRAKSQVGHEWMIQCHIHCILGPGNC